MSEESVETVAPPEGETPVAEPKGQLPDDPAILRAELEKVRKEAAGYRTKAKELEPLAQKAKDLEDAAKTETERLTERLTAAEQRALDAELRAARTEIARDVGLTAAQAKYLTGSTPEEIESSAKQILDDFRPAEADQERPRRRPSELVPGAVSGAEQEPDYDAIADRARRW